MSETTSPSPPPPARRWLGPLILLLLAALAVGVIQSRAEMDNNIRAWLTAAAVALGLVAQLLWLVLFSRLGWRQRLLPVAAVLAVGIGVTVAAVLAYKQPLHGFVVGIFRII